MKGRTWIALLALIGILLIIVMRQWSQAKNQRIDNDRGGENTGEPVPNDPGYRYNRGPQVAGGQHSVLPDCFGPFDLPEFGVKVNFAENFGDGGSFLLAISPRNYNSYYGVRNWGKSIPAAEKLYVLVGVNAYNPPAPLEPSLRLKDRKTGEMVGSELFAYQNHDAESPPLSPGTALSPSTTGKGWFGWIFPIYNLEPGEYQAEVLVNGQLLCGGYFSIR